MSRYYPFELHCHTFHSDGSMSPQRLVERAVEREYAGIAITDHNTVSGAEKVYSEGKLKGLTVLKGIEWTTFYGHIVCISDRQILDWRELSKENIDEKLKFAHENGAIVTLAHPRRMGAPFCIGCHLEFPITRFEYVTAMEVWSQKDSPFNPGNVSAVKFYDSLLTKGYRITAVYGYDWHGEDKNFYNFYRTFLGGKDEKSAKEALIKGDTYISLGVEISAEIDGKKLKFGSEIPCGKRRFKVSAAANIPENITIEKVRYIGTALDSSVETDFGKEAEFYVKEGYLRMECLGKLDGKDTALIFASPYYII